MAPRTKSNVDGSARYDNITFIRHMLAELRQVAEKEGADMLSYLLEMAYVEAGDLQVSLEASSIRHGKRY